MTKSTLRSFREVPVAAGLALGVALMLVAQADAGTPVDIYVCEQCGMLRLFAIER